MKLALGPLQYYWPRDTVFDFYQAMAETPVDVVYLGEAVCSRRRELRQSDWIDIARMLRDAGKHASPNSGWPEAAMAGALGVQLGGLASYDGVAHERPTFGDGPRPSPLDLHRGLGLYLRACAILVAALALGGLAWPR